MTKRETNENRRRLLREMVAEYDIKTIAELEKTLKDMFASTMSDMLKGELDAHLGYEKSSKEPKATTNRRNGSYSKQVRTSMGKAEISIPRDRDGEFEPQLVPNGTRDISGYLRVYVEPRNHIEAGRSCPAALTGVAVKNAGKRLPIRVS